MRQFGWVMGPTVVEMRPYLPLWPRRNWNQMGCGQNHKQLHCYRTRCLSPQILTLEEQTSGQKNNNIFPREKDLFQMARTKQSGQAAAGGTLTRWRSPEGVVPVGGAFSIAPAWREGGMRLRCPQVALKDTSPPHRQRLPCSRIICDFHDHTCWVLRASEECVWHVPGCEGPAFTSRVHVGDLLAVTPLFSLSPSNTF